MGFFKRSPKEEELYQARLAEIRAKKEARVAKKIGASTPNSLVLPIKERGEKILKDNLAPDEKILAKVQGNFGQAIVLTNKRLYIVKWGFQTGSTFGGKCIAYEYKAITAIELRKHMTNRLIVVMTPATRDNSKLSYWGERGKSDNATESDYAITYSDKKLDSTFQAIINLAREIVNKAHNGDTAASSDDSIDKLERLAALKQKGVITEQEFQAKKKQLLGL